MYKTELHCHSAEVSDCATAPASLIVERYVKAGYTSLVLANHLSKYTYKSKRRGEDNSGWSWEKKIDFYMNGYHVLKELAGDRLNIILGCELRSNKDDNDYLIYGVTEEFLRANENLMDVKVEDVHALANAEGFLFIQAHPFRNHMKVTKPIYLDGVEVYNGHIGQESRNDIANLWADKFGFIKTSGSDFHHDKHIISGGIATEEVIRDGAQLVSILKSGNYKLLRDPSVVPC